MKKLSLFILLAVLTVQSNAQYLNVAKNFAPYNGWNGYFTIFYNHDQFTLIGKNIWGQSQSRIQPFIARFSANGDSLGFYQLKDTTKGEFWGFVNTSYRYNPVFPIYTFYNYMNNSKWEAALYKYDSLLNISLITPIQDSISRCLNVTFETKEHNLIGGGWRHSNSTNKSYINITKTDKYGNIIWERNILDTVPAYNLTDGFPLYNDNIVLFGIHNGKSTIFCLDTAGAVLWQKPFSTDCNPAGVEPVPDTTIMVAMDTLIGMNLYGLKLQKLDPVNGNVLWDTTYNLSGSYISSFTTAFRVTSKGECIIAGQTSSYTHYYYLKVNASHQVAFFHKSPYYFDIRINDIIEYKEGGIAGCGGIFVDQLPYRNYSWFFATDANGCIDPGCSTAVGMEELKEPLTLKELSITPNPATEKVSITATQAYHNASLLIFSTLVKETISYPWPEDETTMQLDVRRFPSGTYQLILLTNTTHKEIGMLVVGR